MYVHPSGRKTKEKNLIHGEESQRTFCHLNSPLCPVHACVPSWNWRQEFRSDHQLRDNTFSLLSSSGERAWRTSGIFPKDSVSVQDLIPFQRPHSWYLGWGFWQQSTGVASHSPSELISCFLSSAKQHWVHFGLFNHSLTHRHFDVSNFVILNKPAEKFQVFYFCFCLFVHMYVLAECQEHFWYIIAKAI